MKNVLFLCGPNGIGKTTICKKILSLLPRSAYVDTDPCRMMNPFVLDDNTIPTISKNISGLIWNYLHCPVVDTVIFSYGFHGRRKEVFERILSNLSEIEYRFIPFLLWCSEEENRIRMEKDHRNTERIERALMESRRAYADTPYPKIDLTDLSAEEAAERILMEAKLKPLL